MNLPPPPLSVKKTAEALGVSTDTIYRIIAAGDLTALRIGGAIRIDVAEILRYREASVVHPVQVQTPRGMVRLTSPSPKRKS